MKNYSERETSSGLKIIINNDDSLQVISVDLSESPSRKILVWYDAAGLCFSR